ncbi:MAG: WD40/YVTN/BNR-like repeat-containing protein [Acidobacteriaceae bacterium]
MLKHPILPVAILLTVLISACSSSSGGTLPTASPTQVPPTQEIQPSATPIVPTETPVALPPSPTATLLPGNAIAHFPMGQEFIVTSIHMIDAKTGWAIGGFLSVGDHVLYTTDGGSTWKDVTPPQPVAPGGEMQAAVGFFQDAQTAWVTYYINGGNPVPSQAVVWRTSDGGQVWTSSEPLDLSGLSEIYDPTNMQFVAGLNGWLLAHVGVGMNHDYFVLYRSSDGGASWKRIIDPYNDTSGIQGCTKNNMLFTDATHGWLTGDCNGVKAGVLLYKTTDSGLTWQEVTLPEPTDYPGLFSQEAQVYCGSYDPFFFSNDLGHLSVNCHDYSGTQVTYSYYLYTTRDGGNTWTSTSYPGQSLYFFSADIGWALAAKIQRTTDGGKTWSPISDVSWNAQFDFVSDQIGWAIARADNEVALVRSENGGARWTMLVPKVGQ